SQQQYGFRSGHSVEAQLLSSLEEWTAALDKGYCVDVLYMDFQKAFDTVPHAKLIQKLAALGIRGKLLSWIRSYFMDRKQAVKIGSKLSRWRDITSGVPQGSVLGPLFFILFINDLVELLPAGVTIKLYADDAKIYVIYKPGSWTPLLQQAISVLERWTLDWGLRLAVVKCLLLFLGRLNAKHVYTAFDNPLTHVKVVKDLGILITEDLSWFSHISNIASKASKRANAIFKAFTYSNFEMLARAYVTYIRPVLESASVVWCPHLVQEKRLLESVQRRYSKRIFLRCGMPVPSYEERLQVLGWTTLEARRAQADLCLVFSALKGFTAGVGNILPLASDRFHLRGNHTRLKGSFARLDLRKFFFKNRVIDKWNRLETSIDNFSTTKSFKLYLSNQYK
ncbi:reverse transcriptase family protein, partial [Pseudoalteromonas sp.]|uniref:RNA-directed DNA polymerase n=1 Tax=Pseudoalteromonas sp. TaxID=53249 RepID=UPI00261F27B5